MIYREDRGYVRALPRARCRQSGRFRRGSVSESPGSGGALPRSGLPLRSRRTSSL